MEILIVCPSKWGSLNERKSIGIKSKYNFLSTTLRINHEEGQNQNTFWKHILVSLSWWCVTIPSLSSSMTQVGVAVRGTHMGKWEWSQKVAASVSYHLPCSQIDIYVLFDEANCTPEPLAILFLHMIQVDK